MLRTYGLSLEAERWFSFEHSVPRNRHKHDSGEESETEAESCGTQRSKADHIQVATRFSASPCFPSTSRSQGRLQGGRLVWNIGTSEYLRATNFTSSVNERKKQYRLGVGTTKPFSSAMVGVFI